MKYLLRGGEAGILEVVAVGWPWEHTWPWETWRDRELEELDLLDPPEWQHFLFSKWGIHLHPIATANLFLVSISSSLSLFLSRSLSTPSLLSPSCLFLSSPCAVPQT